MWKSPLAVLLALATSVSAVQFRLATYNIGAHYPGPSPDYGLGDPGSAGFEATCNVLSRINPDVVALQEIHDVDVDDGVAGTDEDLQVLAQRLGMPYLYIPSHTSLDFTLRVVFLSKYPFLSTDSIGSPAAPGADDPTKTTVDMTRRMPVVKVDIPGTNLDPVLISAHLKSADDDSDAYRRTIEMRRLTNYLTAKNITAADNFVILGDFNFSEGVTKDITFAAKPATGVPATFNRGTDIVFPITYHHDDPAAFFTSPVPHRVPLRQVDGSTGTFGTWPGDARSAIDLLLVSPAIELRPLSAEIYNSTLDTSNSVGLAKSGQAPAADSSALASDHFAVFADIELDVGFPTIALGLTAPTVAENSAGGASKLTVTLPAAAAAPVTVNLVSSKASVARPLSPTVVIQAGASSATVDIVTSRDFLASGDSAVTFTASATNYQPGSTALQVLESDAPYRFTAPGQTITENFNGFGGTHDPAPWVSSGTVSWLGVDPGTMKTPGFRAYGSAAESSLGFLADVAVTSPTAFSASFTNQTSAVLDSLEISLTAEQWRASPGGTPDRLTAEILTGAGSIPLPSLAFTAATNLPGGAASAATPLAATISGLAIPAGQAFQLRFTVTPGATPAALPAGVFVNEFHYHNSGTDAGEFVEIAVGPGFTGNLSELSLVLYNGGTTGTTGVNYGTHQLTGFTAGTVTASGHRLFSKSISGIQNGPADGFAIVRNSTQVLQFISYNGVITGTAGPANGLKSTDVGLIQPGTVATGSGSIRLTGTGADAADFNWEITPDLAFSAGAPNGGQTFTNRPPGQGIAIDDLSVKFVDPNLDSDGDGFTDAAETNILLTNPADPNSRFVASIGQTGINNIRLQFPTLTGRKYLIEESGDLAIWTDGPQFSGNGGLRTVDLTLDPLQPKYFYRIRVSLE